MKITIDNDKLSINTIDNCCECGFGGNIIAGNQYKRSDFSKPEYFIDGHGNKIYFDKIKPENYSK